MVPSPWALDARRRARGPRMHARGTENCLTIVQVKSTNKQIKSVYSCDTIKVFPY